jgi:GGDEF domain-containing protein/ActR/RegA family two-component response regulator
MAKALQHRVLLIGDADRELSAAVAQALPGATVRHAASVFDGIAELAQENFATVLAAAEPVGQRPEAAIRALRELTGDGRLVLFGDASLEPLSQKMLPLGCDDYLVTPVTAAQILQVIAAGRQPRVEDDGPLRLHTDYDGPRQARAKPAVEARTLPVVTGMTPPAQAAAILSKIPIADILLEALLEHPGDAIAYALAQLNARLAGDASGPPAMQLSYSPANTEAPATISSARSDLTPVVYAIESAGMLLLHLPAAQEAMGHALLAELGPMLAKAAAIQHRQSRLQKLAFTDDLTGLFNCRYFKHFLGRTLAEARKNRFPVTLFLFDIDNFKSYNDRFGHGVGDDILKQAANLMRRCVRDHDLVARIGGDEFAVVFWEKDGPRNAREAGIGATGRPPSEPHQILTRFRRLLEAQDYPLLGSTGRGTLTISGGLAVFPYDAPNMQTLIDAADKALMLGAKRCGRNTIQIVGGEKQPERGT